MWIRAIFKIWWLYISPPNSPPAADDKAGEARPWWESPAGECQCVSPQPPACHRTLNLKHQQVGELVCVTSTSYMSQNVTSNLGSQEVNCHLKPQTLTSWWIGVCHLKVQVSMRCCWTYQFPKYFLVFREPVYYRNWGQREWSFFIWFRICTAVASSPHPHHDQKNTASTELTKAHRPGRPLREVFK